MVNHITHYQAALFEDLVQDWPALSKWDINTVEGVKYIEESFGKEFLLDSFECSAPLYFSSRPQSERKLKTITELVDAMNGRKTQTKYKVRGG